MSHPIPTKTPNRGIIQELVLECKLILKLFLDRRVSLLLKLIPIAGVLYVLNPVDVPSYLDDLFALVFSLVLFVELCPRQVVAELRKELRSVVNGEWREVPKNSTVIDGVLRDAEDPAAGEKKTEK